MAQAYRLTCHCGAVELAVETDAPLASARRCDCTFCRRRGTPTLTVPLDGLRIVKGEADLRLYQWGTRTARHYFCGTCGIYTHHRRRSNPNEYGVNLGALEGVNPRDFEGFRWADGVNHPSDRT